MTDISREIVLEEELADANEKIAQLETALGLWEPCPIALRLTPKEAKVLGVLMKRPVATHEAMMISLYANRTCEDDLPDPKILDVFVCKMRKKLEPFGIQIETLWGQGWRISSECKMKIAELLTAEGFE